MAGESAYTMQQNEMLFRALARLGHPCGFSSSEQVAVLSAAVDFRLYADVLPALEQCRAAGVELMVTSNWDCSLPEVLQRLGIRGYFRALVVSALEGRAKPEPHFYVLAARRLGLTPSEILHVGDEEANDVAAAEAAGLRAVWLCRHDHTPERTRNRIRSLEELAGILNLRPDGGTGVGSAV